MARHERRARVAWYGARSSAAASRGARRPRASAAARVANPLADLIGHESYSPSPETTTNPCTRIRHPLPTIRPPPGSRETGLETETVALQHTVSFEHTRSALRRRRNRSRYPLGRQPRVGGGADIVDLLRVCEWTWAGVSGHRGRGSACSRNPVSLSQAIEAWDACLAGRTRVVPAWAPLMARTGVR
jgi:hypothetical protein